jgi:hypothetical protein
VPARLPLEEFPQNLMLGTFIKISRENPNVFQVGKNVVLCTNTQVHFIVSGKNECS